MKELLYFSSADLMVQVSYEQDANSLHYYSHRKLSFGERVIVEQYLLTNIAVKTEYYKRDPSVLHYNGVNSKLVKELNQFHLKNTLSILKEKEREVDESVKNLIDKSMSNYYFEQIGNTLVEMRQAIADQILERDLGCYRSKLEELVDAYNHYSERNISYAELIPEELQAYF